MNPEETALRETDQLPIELQQRMLSLARESIEFGLENGEPAPFDGDTDFTTLHAELACFVTLRIRGKLRGCIGTVTPRGNLGQDICRNAYRAAFHDPRFPPLTRRELPELNIKISILTEPAEFPVESEQELLDLLVPGKDGLILNEGPLRALFLPTVWADLPEPRTFLKHLKRKANLPPGYWSPDLRFQRFRSIEIGNDHTS